MLRLRLTPPGLPSQTPSPKSSGCAGDSRLRNHQLCICSIRSFSHFPFSFFLEFVFDFKNSELEGPACVVFFFCRCACLPSCQHLVWRAAEMRRAEKISRSVQQWHDSSSLSSSFNFSPFPNREAYSTGVDRLVTEYACSLRADRGRPLCWRTIPRRTTMRRMHNPQPPRQRRARLTCRSLIH